MITWKYFVTAFSNQLNTFRLTTAVLKCLHWCLILLFNFSGAKSTFLCILVVLRFFASHAHMVWCFFAACTEIVLATCTPNSKSGHMISSLFRDYLTSWILLFVIRFGGLKHNNTLAFTSNHFRVKFYTFFHLQSFNLIDFFPRHHFFNFLKLDHSTTLET